MISFAWPWLGFLWLLAPLSWWLLRPAQKRFSTLRVPNLFGPSSQNKKESNYHWRTLLALLVWTLLVIAAARPQWLGEPVQIRSEAREMMLAVDLSGSMEIADMEINGDQVNRLTMVKHVLRDFINRRVGDKLGLILFADTAYVQAPMTYDRASVQQLLDESVLRLIGERTAIGDAVALSVKRFKDNTETNRILVLLTDGQNTAGAVSPEQAKQLAEYYGVKIYAIGVGAEEYVLDSFFGERKVNPSRDLDEDMLRDLAASTGGEYFRARSTEELEEIYRLLDQYEPVAGDAQQLRPKTELYFWPAGAAWLLMLFWAMVRIWRPNLNREVPNVD